MRPNATSIYRMFRQGSGKQAIGCPSILGNQLFGQVNGLRELDPSRASCPRPRLDFDFDFDGVSLSTGSSTPTKALFVAFY
jgi:hypothetical protein